jgi:hemerythrin
MRNANGVIAICNLKPDVPDFTADRRSGRQDADVCGSIQRLSERRKPCNSMLEWKSDYETGVTAIDTQHKVLFDNINRLGQLLDKEDIERAEADYLLKFLKNYAQQHFKGEESCMARFRCPAYGKNKEEHTQFRTTLGFAIGQYESSTKPKDVLQRLHESMDWWIRNHILRVDIQLKDCTGGKAGAA